MGWWGHDVLSGDAPLDVLSWFAADLGLQDPSSLDVYPDGTIDDPAARDQVCRRFTTATLDSLTALVYELAGVEDDTTLTLKASSWAPEASEQAVAAYRAEQDRHVRVVWQVLAVVAMAAGAALSDEVRATMIAAGVEDDWAASNPARRAAMDRYVACLRDYRNGVPTALSSATLADAVVRAEQVGHVGLLNVDPPAAG